ncbi:MAG: hypothetical protein ABI867_05360 [Kofleriaceae bacterium]
MISIARRCIASLGRLPSAVLVVAALAIGVMYCANDNVDPKLGPPRGDGVYRPALARGDGHMHYLITRSIVFDHDFDFDNDLAEFGDPWRQPKTVTGKKNVMQQIGPSLIWAPALVVAHAAALIGNAFGADIGTNGYTLFHQRVVFATSVMFAWLAIGLGVLVAFRIAGGRWGPAFAGTAVLLGTTLTYYATFMPGYAHAMDAAVSALFLGVWALTIGERRWRRFVILGILLGLATMVRVQDIAFGIVLALELVLAMKQDRSAIGALIGRGAATLAIALVMFTPQLYVWNQYYGSWVTTPQGPGQMRYGHPMVLEFLWSSRNGWLSTHPIAYLGTIGLGVGAFAGPRIGKHVRLVSIAMLLAILTQIYVNAVTYEWWSAASFGQRRMASVTLPIVVGLAVLLRYVHLRAKRIPAWGQLAIAVAILGYLVAWNLAWVGRLTSGAPAGRDNKPTCCKDVAAPLSWIAQPIYAVVGNPFELPASAWFAVRHGVSVQRWDDAVGNYALVPGVLGYEDGSYRKVSATWNAIDERYVVDGFGALQRAGSRSWRWTTQDSATLLVPFLMPEPHRITIPLAANTAEGEPLYVQINCNGKLVATGFVRAGWTSLTFDTDGTVGESSIEILAAARPYRGSVPPAPGEAEMGVAVGPLRVALP